MDTEKKIKKLLKVIGKIGIDSQDSRVFSLIEDLRKEDFQIIPFETGKTWLVGDEVWWWNTTREVPEWGKIKEFNDDTALVICQSYITNLSISVKDLGALVGDSSAEYGNVTFTRGDEVRPNPVWYGWEDRRMWCLDFLGQNTCRVLIVSSLAGIYTSKEPLSSLEKLGELGG